MDETASLCTGQKCYLCGTEIRTDEGLMVQFYLINVLAMVAPCHQECADTERNRQEQEKEANRVRA